MEKDIKQIDNSKRELTLNLTTQELVPHYEAAYKKAQPNIDLKGFRKGKVPIKMIKKLYGPGIEADADQDIINNEFQKLVQEDNIQVIGAPVLKDIDKNDEGIKYTVEFEVIPTLQLNDFKGLKLEEPVHAVEESEVEKEIENLLVQRGELENAEQADNDNHVVTVTMHELDEESGTPIDGKEAEETNLFLGDENIVPELKESLLNTKAGDTFEYSNAVSEENKKYLVTVKEIQRVKPRELTNEFVEEVSEGRFKEIEDFKEELSFSMQEEWDEKSRQALENQIVDKLIADNDVPAPEPLVSQVMTSMIEDLKRKYPDAPEMKNATVETMRGELEPMAVRSVKWELIRNAIVEKEEIEVEEHDIDPVVEQEAQRFGQEKEKIKQLLMQNPNFMGQIISKKVIDFIIDFAIMEEVDFETGEPIHDDDK